MRASASRSSIDLFGTAATYPAGESAAILDQSRAFRISWRYSSANSLERRGGDDDGQLGGDSETEVEISGSEAEIELGEAAGAEPDPERNRNKNSSGSSNSGGNSSAR